MKLNHWHLGIFQLLKHLEPHIATDHDILARRVGVDDEWVYNRIANFVILSRDINIKIGKTAPSDYLTHITDYGSNVADRLPQNLADNCIPADPELWKLENYDAFMKERNKLISQLIREYYESL